MGQSSWAIKMHPTHFHFHGDALVAGLSTGLRAWGGGLGRQGLEQTKPVIHPSRLHEKPDLPQ
jgi:hypothetical protein